MTPGFALFDTPIGVCGLAWSERGITDLLWPQSRPEPLRRSLGRRRPTLSETEPPEAVAEARRRVVALLRDGTADLTEVPLDLSAATDFERRVYEIARSIAAGSTLTYGEIARRLGGRLLAREVGQALGRNPIPIIVPCHRVLAAGGGPGGFSAPGGVAAKLKLLRIEGVFPGGQPGLFDD
jgi:methylated-DNA-[protein]-cysteine S-methyltransferase